MSCCLCFWVKFPFSQNKWYNKQKTKENIVEIEERQVWYMHGCQNFDLDPTILRFYDLTCPKQSRSFKNFCDHSVLIGSHDSDNPKRF